MSSIAGQAKKVYFATTRQCLKGFSDTLQCNKFSPLIFGSVNLLKRCFFNIFKTFFMILFSNRLFYNDLFIMTCLYTEFLYNSLFVYSTYFFRNFFFTDYGQKSAEIEITINICWLSPSVTKRTLK